MGFLDKAKAAANELAAKADTALASSGLAGPPGTHSPDKLLRDLGVLAWQELNGSPAPEGERERIVAALREAEQRGALGTLTLQTAAPPPMSVPPPPGAAQPPPPPGGAAAPPPPPPGAASPAPEPPPVPASDPSPAQPTQPTAPPPPPPSWAKSDES